MKTEDLKAQGLSDEQIQFVMKENGKDIKELQTKNGKLEDDLTEMTTRATTAEDTLKKFDGIDPEQIQTELADWKKKAEDAEKDYNAKIAERDFSDALRTELESIKFSSESAKEAISAKIKEAGLKLSNGKILGLNDLLEQIKEKDASAFVDEDAEQAKGKAASFTKPGTGGGKPGQRYTMSELMKMKNENPDLDISQYMANVTK